MFRIGTLELTLTCGLFLLILVIPWMITKFYAQLDKRLKNIEKKIDKKKE